MEQNQAQVELRSVKSELENAKSRPEAKSPKALASLATALALPIIIVARPHGSAPSVA